jgi:uncharacterized protein (UPF0332 family)
MTFSEAQPRHIVEIRLANAEQMLVDPADLLGGGSLRSAANRCYYAVFYAASALAMHDNQTSHKHRGVIAYFHKTYVKTGRLPKELGAVFQRAFDNRCEADYDDLIELQQDELADLLKEAGRLVAAIESLIKSN